MAKRHPSLVVIRSFLIIFSKFHLLVYFIFQNNNIGDTAATLWRRIAEDSRSLKKQKAQNLSAESQQK